jgi:hypothetical protein
VIWELTDDGVLTIYGVGSTKDYTYSSPGFLLGYVPTACCYFS